MPPTNSQSPLVEGIPGGICLQGASRRTHQPPAGLAETLSLGDLFGSLLMLFRLPWDGSLLVCRTCWLFMLADLSCPFLLLLFFTFTLSEGADLDSDFCRGRWWSGVLSLPGLFLHLDSAEFSPPRGPGVDLDLPSAFSLRLGNPSSPSLSRLTGPRTSPRGEPERRRLPTCSLSAGPDSFSNLAPGTRHWLRRSSLLLSEDRHLLLERVCSVSLPGNLPPGRGPRSSWTPPH